MIGTYTETLHARCASLCASCLVQEAVKPFEFFFRRGGWRLIDRWCWRLWPWRWLRAVGKEKQPHQQRAARQLGEEKSLHIWQSPRIDYRDQVRHAAQDHAVGRTRA